MIIGIDGRALQSTPWGGVGQYTYQLFHALFALDRENEYVVWYNGFGKIAVPDFSEYSNVRVHRTRWPNKLLNFLCIVLQDFHFSILHFKFELLVMTNLNFIALPSRVRLVMVAHDLSFEHFPEFFLWKARWWHRALNPRALFGRADQIIAVSEHTKGDLVETYGIAPEKVRVVYPGVIKRGPASPPADGEAGPPYILYLGALEPRKNIEGIIEAFELLHSGRSAPRNFGGRVSGYRLVIAGLSTPYVKYLKRRISRSKMRDQITLQEDFTEKEKAKLYAGAHIFVYPSFYEGFGFPPLEAMSYGVPVVASAVASVPEICGDSAILVNPWDVREIKEGMGILGEDGEMRKQYIAAGYARVEEFSWEQCARQLQGMFQRAGP